MMPEIAQQRDEGGHNRGAGTKSGEAELPRLIAQKAALVIRVGSFVVDIGLHQFNPESPLVVLSVTHSRPRNAILTR